MLLIMRPYGTHLVPVYVWKINLLLFFPPSENYLVRWPSSGLPKDIDRLHNLRAVFTVSPSITVGWVSLCPVLIAVLGSLLSTEGAECLGVAVTPANPGITESFLGVSEFYLCLASLWDWLLHTPEVVSVARVFSSLSQVSAVPLFPLVIWITLNILAGLRIAFWSFLRPFQLDLCWIMVLHNNLWKLIFLGSWEQRPEKGENQFCLPDCPSWSHGAEGQQHKEADFWAAATFWRGW